MFFFQKISDNVEQHRNSVNLTQNQNKLVSNGARKNFSLLVHSCHPVFLSSNISYEDKTESVMRDESPSEQRVNF